VASDPFQLGWNLFATIDYQFNIAVVDAGDVWYLSLFAIVIGHVCAVWIAHITALRATVSTRQAMISQIPMLALMVAYTMTSLWILSQPIIS
jgi:ABC-type proline/glycine betaine transport system permease subunit